MAEYRVLARKYRPQNFREVLGQQQVVTTLKNAIRFNRLAHAYLFCGSRGTGKTTLARILAKAINCQNPSDDQEPCNQCCSCKEITTGQSLDVLEIDGASNRGIDDIRQINETVGYIASSGKYKIYIIDEVHMLTKEAFNALLKTLEEPPLNVKFFFATTEPHKVLPTILSRCQRFNLQRISLDIILNKLIKINNDLKLPVQEEALRLIASRADGSLRDAESLLDQILAFHEGEITVASTAAVLGIMPYDCFFEIDRAGKEGDLGKAFEISHRVFSEGKDLGNCIEGLLEHFRNLLIVKLAGKNSPNLSLSMADKEKYEASAKLYSQEQCMTNLDFLIDIQGQMRTMPLNKMTLEMILLRIIRNHQRLPVEYLVRRLIELEQAVQETSPTPTTLLPPDSVPQANEKTKVVTPPVIEKASMPESKQSNNVKKQESSLTEDPSPSATDFDNTKLPTAIELGARPTEEAKRSNSKQKSKQDTLLQFAAVELEGTIQKKLQTSR